MKAKKRILVVDDQTDITEAVCSMLAEAGFDTRQAAVGSHCLELCRSYRPALVILDIRLPDMDGWEVMSRIARFERPVPVLISSAAEHAGKKLLGFNLLPDQDYIIKPYDPAELVAKVDALLGLSPRVAEQAG